MKTISLKLSAELNGKLERVARRLKQTKSELVRDTLERYLNSPHAGRPGSALDLAKNWVGCIEGPGDLATNPKYMDNFGQ